MKYYKTRKSRSNNSFCRITNTLFRLIGAASLLMFAHNTAFAFTYNDVCIDGSNRNDGKDVTVCPYVAGEYPYQVYSGGWTWSDATNHSCILIDNASSCTAANSSSQNETTNSAYSYDDVCIDGADRNDGKDVTVCPYVDGDYPFEVYSGGWSWSNSTNHSCILIDNASSCTADTNESEVENTDSTYSYDDICIDGDDRNDGKDVTVCPYVAGDYPYQIYSGGWTWSDSTNHSCILIDNASSCTADTSGSENQPTDSLYSYEDVCIDGSDRNDGKDVTVCPYVDGEYPYQVYSGGWTWSDSTNHSCILIDNASSCTADTNGSENPQVTCLLSDEDKSNCTDINMQGSTVSSLIVSAQNFPASGKITIRNGTVRQGTMNMDVIFNIPNYQTIFPNFANYNSPGTNRGGQIKKRQNAGNCVNIQRSNVVLKDMTITNCDEHGAYISNGISSIEFENVNINNTGHHGILFANHSTSNGVKGSNKVTGGTIQDIGADGIAGSVHGEGTLSLKNLVIQRVDQMAKDNISKASVSNACDWDPYDSSGIDTDSGRAFMGDCVHIQNLDGNLNVDNLTCDHTDFPTKNGIIVQNQSGNNRGNISVTNSTIRLYSSCTRQAAINAGNANGKSTDQALYDNLQSRDPKGIQLQGLGNITITGTTISGAHSAVSLNGFSGTCTIDTSDFADDWVQYEIQDRASCGNITP